MSMKERDRERFLERQQQAQEARQTREKAIRRGRRHDALMRNARLVYDHDRDFPGDFSDES